MGFRHRGHGRHWSNCVRYPSLPTVGLLSVVGGCYECKAVQSCFPSRTVMNIFLVWFGLLNNPVSISRSSLASQN